MSRILIRLPNWLGDAVMASGAVRRFVEEHPDDEIHLQGEPSALPVYFHLPDNVELEPLDPMWRRSLGGVRDASKAIKSKSFDQCYLLTNSFSSALLPWLSAIPERIGYKAHWRSGLLTMNIPRPAGLHHASLYNRLLNENDSFVQPVITISDEERSEANKLLNSLGFEKERLVGVAAGAAYGPAKCWPHDRYLQLSQRLISQSSTQNVFFGSPAEAESANELASRSGSDAESLAGRTSLRQLFALIEQCRLIISNDSGVMHVAWALQRPHIALFGPTNQDATGPVHDNAHVINKRLDCAPCMKRTCPLKHHKCMKEIEVDEVYKLVESIMKRF